MLSDASVFWREERVEGVAIRDVLPSVKNLRYAAK